MPTLNCDLKLDAYWLKFREEIAVLRNWHTVTEPNGTVHCPTLKHYTNYIDALAPHLKKTISTLTFFDIQHALENVKTQYSYKASTMASYRALLSDIYRFAQDRGDAYNIMHFFSTRKKSSSGNAANSLSAVIDPSLPKIEMLARVRAALEDRKYLPRSFLLPQQAHLIRIIDQNIETDGRYCGLASMLYDGPRPAECRKVSWGDLVPFLDHPDRYMLCLNNTLNSNGALANKMKTPNAYRKVPVPIELQKLLLKRKAFVEAQLKLSGSTAKIEDFPICCYMNNFDTPCRDYQFSALASEVLTKLSMTQEDLSLYLLDLINENLGSSNTNEDTHLSLYVLRRNFWTWLQSSTQLTEMEKRYVMGHEMLINGQDLRPFFNDETVLWDICQKMDRHIISLRLHEDLLRINLESDNTLMYENKGFLHFRLSPEQLSKGGTLHIRATAVEADDPVSLTVYSPIKDAYGKLRVDSHMTECPASSTPVTGINCESDNFRALNKLRTPKNNP